MDPLSGAASVIAMIQISGQILDLCQMYYSRVKDTRKGEKKKRVLLKNIISCRRTKHPLAGGPGGSSTKRRQMLVIGILHCDR